MKKLVLLLLAILLMSGCNGKPSAKKITQTKEKALELIAKGDYQSAIDALTDLLEYDDEDKSLTYTLVDAYVGLENYPKAIEYLNGIDSEDETIKERIFTYSVAEQFKSLATVDFSTLKDLKVDYLQNFNDKYILFKSGDKYGLLNRNYEIALAAKYYGIIIGDGYNRGKIMVFKSTKLVKKHYEKDAIVLDGNLKETKKKGSNIGYCSLIGYLIDTTNKNKFYDASMKPGCDKGDWDFEKNVKLVKSLDKDMVIPAAKVVHSWGDGWWYEYAETDYLVKASDLSIHKLTGNFASYNYEDIPPIKEGMIPVYKKNKCGYYNTEPTLVVDFTYDTFSYNMLPQCSNFSSGYAVVRANDKYGIIDKDGKLIIPSEFEGLTDIVNGEFLILYQGRVGIGKLK